MHIKTNLYEKSNFSTNVPKIWATNLPIRIALTQGLCPVEISAVTHK